ncbi:hypothetical protein AXE65_11065 [Ventosimonas gracilis]|uniref:Lipid/polyisoprenoid-binding YceI-like domain-containing protein n=1 Tax=Ventosimonas gracilis TaxID=1680762 RepID=A0A139SWH6_9GAMM|nr:YceI family protein [Ventosimonas gracilis]KXU38975.1 hypothetical protein AXE65_11065 [Ventosimonas gracilis]
MLKKTLITLAISSALFGGLAQAADYKMDTERTHAFVNIKVNHLGFSFVTGTFRDFDGSFSFDANKPEEAKVQVTLKTASLFTNNAERDKHVLGKDFLNTSKFPEATFVSSKVVPTGTDDKGRMTADVTGDLTLMGTTKPILIKATLIGDGKDPWGGERVGFEGTSSINRQDFAKMMDLGPQSNTVELYFTFEGIRQ